MGKVIRCKHIVSQARERVKREVFSLPPKAKE